MIKKVRRRWALKVGCALLSPLNSRVHRPFNTLRRQLPWAVGAPATSRTTIFRTGASGALVSPMHHSRVFPRHPTRLTCSFALYARAPRVHTVQDAPLHHLQCSSVAVHRHLGARGISCTELHRAPRCRRTSLHLPASAPTVQEGCTESWHRRCSVHKCCMLHVLFFSDLLLYFNR